MNQRIMSVRERKDREKLGWETELDIKAKLVKQDEAFCKAMRKAIAHGLEMQLWVK
jgi:hypothetical protein